MGKVFPRILLYETVFVNRMPSYIAEAVGNLLTGNEEVGAAQGGGLCGLQLGAFERICRSTLLRHIR